MHDTLRHSSGNILSSACSAIRYYWFDKPALYSFPASQAAELDTTPALTYTELINPVGNRHNSMTDHITAALNPTSSQDASLTWTLHLARKHPAKLALCIGTGAFAIAAGFLALGSLGAAAVAVVMLGATADFLFPVRFEITPEGAVSKTLLKCTRIAWDQVSRCYLDNDGVKLSPLDRVSRIEAFRGVYLRFAGNREQVIKAVNRMRAKTC